MRALRAKLLRDLRRLRTQVITISVVVAIGVAGFVGMFAVHASLLSARDDFYRTNRLADVFAGVRRAPESLRTRVAALDGVAEVKTETAFDAQVDLPGVDPPVTGRFVGLDLGAVREARQGLNRLTLERGRWPEAGQALEAVVSDRFATARGLAPGQVVHALIEGRRQAVHLVGTVASPEHVFATQGGGPDDLAFGLWWVDARRLAELVGMQGAFNRVSVTLASGVAPAAVIDALDRLLEPYGTTGAHGRDRLPSARIVDDELSQLRVMGTVLPAIFLAVAMFILNVVLGRQVATQRYQIAALKALGYRDGEIAWHYLQLALVIAAIGIVAGLALSVAIGRGMLGLYAEVFRFERLAYFTDPAVVAAAALITLAAAATGTWAAIRSIVRLRPAQAMQPPAPPAYRPTLLERLAPARRPPPAALMVVRHIERRPLRAALTVIGIALAVALQISGAFWMDAIAHIVDVQFRRVQQGDVLVSFHRPVPVEATRALAALPGVLEAEVHRSEPVRVRAGGRTEDTVLTGLRPQASLMRVIDERRGPVPMPPDGVVLSALLARELDVGPGDRIEVEFRQWNRRRLELEVVDVARTMIGKPLYMDLDAMNRAAGDGAGAGAAALRIDPQAHAQFWAAIKGVPAAGAVFDKAGALAAFRASTERTMGIFSLVLTLFSIAMAVGIIDNAARIALSERAWELASLRVLGMSRRQVSVLLLAELALEGLLALPLGMLAGWGLAHLLMALMSSDAIDFPVVIEPATYASAVLIVMVAGVVSALLVRRQVDRLDLVSVLKVRE